jgi:hypothetical protein
LFWDRKRRERQAREQALREECRQLRYIAAWKDISELDDKAIQTLLHRVVQARRNLQLVIYGHDDSTNRLVTAGLGASATAIGIATLTATAALPFVAGIVSVCIGVGLVANDVVGFTTSRLALTTDEGLYQVLGDLSAKIHDDCRRRGIVPPGDDQPRSP